MVVKELQFSRNYQSGILKSLMVSSKDDFFIPEYDNLGMQPSFDSFSYEVQE